MSLSKNKFLFCGNINNKHNFISQKFNMFKLANSIRSNNFVSFGKRLYSTQLPAFNTLILSRPSSNVTLITLNRPKALNALNNELVSELRQAIEFIEKDTTTRCSVITGSEKAFAAGADIKEMSELSYSQVYKTQLFKDLDALETVARKPVIAAVNGFALGGGCELAMMCDMIIAGTSARFGQPEIKIGTIPGIGGTQRLTKLVGKGVAMEWVLTGDIVEAKEAERVGLVNKVVEDPVAEALKIAEKIAQWSQPIVMLAKESVKKSLELNLREGLAFEQKAFQSTFATKDRELGMKTFAEKGAKAKPEWTDE